VLVLACAAQFMVVLDVSVVNVALPAIRGSLGFTGATQQWVVTAYALVFAGFLLLGGRLADLWGAPRVFAGGLALFTAASLAGGCAPTPGVLVAARAAQGLGAAVLAPATLTLLTTAFPEGPERSRALAAWTAVAVGGGAAGNLVGGVLTEYLSWRWTLLVNVPVGAPALLAALTLPLAGGGRGGGARLDVPGAAAVTVGVAALTLGLTRIAERGAADAAAVGALAGGAAALALFAVVEARVAPVPLVPPRLLRVRALAVGNTVMLLTGACLVPMWYFLSLYLQDVLGYGPLRTGAAFLPHTLTTMAVAARVAPPLLDRFGARALVAAGAAVAALGFLWQSRTVPDDGYLAGVLAPGVVLAAGSGLLTAPLTAAATSGVRPGDAGAASGLLNTTKQVGGVLGLAALVVVAGSGGPGGGADHGRAFLAIAGLLAAAAAAALALPRGVPGEDVTSRPASGRSWARRRPRRPPS
jgi:EmrB/QacA subfamily drug resistance transporter